MAYQTINIDTLPIGTVIDVMHIDDTGSYIVTLGKKLDKKWHRHGDGAVHVIREAINQQLPVPYETLNQVDFVGYEMFLHRTIDAVKPIIRLDRLYPDPIAFRLMW